MKFTLSEINIAIFTYTTLFLPKLAALIFFIYDIYNRFIKA